MPQFQLLQKLTQKIPSLKPTWVTLNSIKIKKYNKVLEIQLSEETLVWYECSLGLTHKGERETDMGRDTDSSVGCVLYIYSI